MNISDIGQASVQAIETAIFLAVVVRTITDYLKAPFLEVPMLRDWMLRHKLAYYNGDNNLRIWFVPYVTFVFGLVLSIVTRTDIVQPFLPTANSTIRIIISGVIVGGGSNIIHSLVSR